MPFKKKIGQTLKSRESKDCLTCLRPFENRKRWSSRDMWDKVLYCSKLCQKMKDDSTYKEKFKKNAKK